ncbi:type-2 ice-structuring protein-like [Sphaeramia orbicularis]|uniref:type-2 ice-structuring protein-like n=1 Tax=Sphaeramia orbicularis TaxID=375764 RepID=UPI00117E6520|nr:type-2 ice-structuring protein-like [Sphaeramia orbicularis]
MLTVSVLLCALVALSTADDDVIPATNRRHCRLGWKYFDHHCFHYVAEEMSWADAEKNCQKHKGNLASVHSEAELQFIHSLQPAAAAGVGMWIGGSDCYKEGSWMWSDGSVFQFTYWCPAEPNNLNGTQNCLETGVTSCNCWNDVACNQMRPSMCRTDH